MEHILSLSYGKDSLACLGAIEELGWELDRIVHAEVWATDTIPADLPPMVEFKAKADKIIKDRWGIEVEHVCAMDKKQPNNYEKQFYTTRHNKAKNIDCIYGSPCQRGAWCNSKLKVAALEQAKKITYEKCFYTKYRKGSKRNGQMWGFPTMNSNWCNSRLKMNAVNQVQKHNISYIGIASDEPSRFHNLTEFKKSPLVEAGWTEAKCREWCVENDLLSPIYTTATRGGCWFCHNQGVDQLRQLRHNYPEYWALMLKWDNDSPVTFHADGHTVHDFDKRFQLEDDHLISANEPFRWAMLEAELNLRLF